MRVFTRALLTLVLMFVALVAANALRLGRVPAQGAPEGPPAAARNGDVNCDGLLDITDPILVLNWLFSDGPEPCAIAQTDTCCTELGEQVAELSATVAALAARSPSPKDIVLIEKTVSGGSGTLFTVPADKWLVVTSIAYGSGAYPTLRKFVDGQSTDVPMGGQVLDILGEKSQAWTTGAAFPPGSRVDVAGFTGLLRLNGYLAGE